MALKQFWNFDVEDPIGGEVGRGPLQVDAPREHEVFAKSLLGERVPRPLLHFSLHQNFVFADHLHPQVVRGEALRVQHDLKRVKVRCLRFALAPQALCRVASRPESVEPKRPTVDAMGRPTHALDGGGAQGELGLFLTD